MRWALRGTGKSPSRIFNDIIIAYPVVIFTFSGLLFQAKNTHVKQTNDNFFSASAS